MKRNFIYSIVFCFLVLFSFPIIASEAWSKKADFSGGDRELGIGFSIGSYGYAGCGRNPAEMNDFWQYDPVSDSWAQVASYPGSGRYGMVGFSIGNFGYAGTGWIGIGGGANQFRDFWQYDPGSNSWLQKADFGGSGRYSAVGFSIGSKGYVGLGYSPIKNDFWEYDPIGDSWIQMANFPSNRLAAVGFGIGAKGYVGTGYDNNNNSYRDFYEFDPMANSWTVKSDVPGLFRRGAVGFSVGLTGFVGMGYNDTTYLTDFFRYDPGTDIWTEAASIGGVPRYGAFAFSMNNYGYVGTGSYGGIITVIPTHDFYRIEDCGGSGVGIFGNPDHANSISMLVTSNQHKSLHIKYDLGYEETALFQLFDATGRLVLQSTLLPGPNSTSFSVLLSTEIYFYSVSNDGKKLASGKVLVN